MKINYEIKTEKKIYRWYQFFLIYAKDFESLVFLILYGIVADECFWWSGEYVGLTVNCQIQIFNILNIINQ